MTEDRVILQAEQEGRSFKWLLTRPMAEHLLEKLREKGWAVEIQPDGQAPAESPGKD
jgi:hypothetical protein